MPLTRYQIRNEFSLADPELYRVPDKNDPEALLEGVAMAGLVGLLRQLGDLSEFAADLFHNLHEEVMATASRSHGLMNRLQQVEADIPLVEKAFLSKTSDTKLLYNAGIDWHPNLRMDQNLITQGDLPRFIMDSYEECRGPPRLFLLDKFDIAGAGACSKRYSDPSFFKTDFTSSEKTNTSSLREKKARKIKRRASLRRNGEALELVPTSNSKLHQLFLEENNQTGNIVPIHHVKLKRRVSNFSSLDPTTEKSYMQKFLDTSSPEIKTVYENSVSPLLLTMEPDTSRELVSEVQKFGTRSPDSKLGKTDGSPTQSLSKQDKVLEQSFEESIPGFELKNNPPTIYMVEDRKEFLGRESKPEPITDRYPSDEVTSEIDNFVDALTTMESEMETDIGNKPKYERGLNIVEKGGDVNIDEKQHKLQVQFSDSHSNGSSIANDDGSNSFIQGRFSLSYSNITITSTEDKPLGDMPDKLSPTLETSSAGTVHEYSESLFDNGDSLRLGYLDRLVPYGPCNRASEESLSTPQMVGTSRTVEMLDDGSTVELDLPHSVTLSTNKKFHDMENRELESGSATIPPRCLPNAVTHDKLDGMKPDADGVATEIQNVISSSGKKEELTSVESHPDSNDFAEHNAQRMIDDNPPAELESASSDFACSEVETSYGNFERFSKATVCDVQDGSALDCVDFDSVGTSEKRDIPLDSLSEYAGAVIREPSSVTEVHSQLADLASGTSYAKGDEEDSTKDHISSGKSHGNGDSGEDKLGITEIMVQRHLNGPDAKIESVLGSSDFNNEQCDPQSEKPSTSQSEAPLEQRSEIKDGQLNVWSLHEDEVNEESSNHIDCDERDEHSVYSYVDPLCQPSEPKFSCLPTSHKSERSTVSEAIHEQALDSAPSTAALVFSQPDHSALQANMEETTALPPFHPNQWRVGAHQYDSQTSEGQGVQPSFNLYSQLSPPATDQRDQHGFPSLVGKLAHPPSEPNTDDEKPQQDPKMFDGKLVEPCTDPLPSLPATKNEMIQQDTNTSLPQAVREDEKSQNISSALKGQVVQHPDPFTQSTTIEDCNPEHGGLYLNTNGGMTWQWPSYPVAPYVEHGKANEVLTKRIPRPKNPLVEEFVSRDKILLRKIEERVLPKPRPNLAGRDSLLEQIRSKSFNLKPAVATRPSIKGPNTNLKVVAILEKANAIRQALAGSDDEDDDDDSWSDS